VFSPGNPTSFQSNYLAGQALLAELEGLASSRAAVERLRGSTAAAGWAKRWNLPVYFSLVYQDIAGVWGCRVCTLVYHMVYIGLLQSVWALSRPAWLCFSWCEKGHA
jgi:hypothetical protein